MVKKLLLAGTAFSALSGVALAADLPYRSAPPPFVAPLPIFTWTGFYIGANAGYAFNNSNRIDTTIPGLGALIGNGNDNYSLRNDSDGFTGGGQFGYNYQFGAGSGIVVGVEADAAYTDLGQTRGINTSNIVAGSGATYRSSLDYLGTIRGRVGYAFNQFLVYGTGGFAYGGVSRHARVFDGANNTLASANFDDTETGYAYGGGVEYALPTGSFLNFFHAGAVTVKAEYLHYELNSTNASLNVAGTAVSARLRNDGDLARAGINYKF